VHSNADMRPAWHFASESAAKEVSESLRGSEVGLLCCQELGEMSQSEKSPPPPMRMGFAGYVEDCQIGKAQKGIPSRQGA
jgi:hypothetical protein